MKEPVAGGRQRPSALRPQRQHVMKAGAAAVVALGLAVPAFAQAQGSGPSPSIEGSPMKVRMTIGTSTVDATLVDNPTSRDFLSLLPLTLTFEDYASTEKIAYPPRKLSTSGAPEGSTPVIGGIFYYAPWGNLAIFYRDFEYSRGLIPLGRIDSGLEAFRAGGSRKVEIKRVAG